MAITDGEETTLRRGLERWRERRLGEIERAIEEQNYLHGRAAFGLEQAHKAPGVYDQPAIEELWGELNESAKQLVRLDQEHQDLVTMDLPHLVVAFKRDTAAQVLEPAGRSTPSIDIAGDRVDQILRAWRELMGMDLDRERVRAHLDSLNKWQQRRKKTRDAGDGA